MSGASGTSSSLGVSYIRPVNTPRGAENFSIHHNASNAKPPTLARSDLSTSAALNDGATPILTLLRAQTEPALEPLTPFGCWRLSGTRVLLV